MRKELQLFTNECRILSKEKSANLMKYLENRKSDLKEKIYILKVQIQTYQSGLDISNKTYKLLDEIRDTLCELKEEFNEIEEKINILNKVFYKNISNTSSESCL